MDKESMVKLLREAIPVDVAWGRLRKADLERLVAFVSNPREAATTLAELAAQRRASDFVSEFFASLRKGLEERTK